jgi:hypothetical protein
MGCLYRGPNGGLCAIGVLISDEAYTSDIDEGYYKVGHTSVLAALRASGVNVDEVGLEFLESLQNIHDDVSPDEWGSALVRAAYHWNLKLP